MKIREIMSSKDDLIRFRDYLRKIDYTGIRDDKPDTCFANKAGLIIVDYVIRQILNGLTEQYFFEYSLVMSTINPKSGNLYSFSGVRTSNEEFKNNISQNVGRIISHLYPTKSDKDTKREERIDTLAHNWFHNPEMFLFPSIDKVEPFYQKGGSSHNQNMNWVALEESSDINFISAGKDFFVANMSYRRALDEMLEASSQIVRCTTGVDITTSLIEEYHKGAQELKSWYDHYLPIEKNGEKGNNYDYITFPIVSSCNADINNYYKKYFPSFNDGHVAGIGHFFLYLKRSDNSNNKIDESVLIELFVRINQIINHIALNYVYGTGIVLLENARKEAIKSAKAAIMSRNISHNLGSHVMAYMKQDLCSVEDMLKKGVLKEALPCEGVSLNEKEIPYLVGVGKFLSYLQERQDYIATVSTDYIPYPSIVNFKDAIFDELNPDYRFQRHTEWKGHKPANILLENIAKSEGLSRKTLENNQIQDGNNIIIRYGEFDGLNQDNANEDYEKLRKWNFSLPGGIMGRQAIFSIVENVIRNAAKHGTRRNGENLTVTFDIVDPLTDDNFLNDAEYKEYYTSEDIRDLYVVRLTTSNKIDETGFKKISDALNDTLIEDNGQLKQSNKGIKEMLISAAWLRGIKIEDLNHGQINKMSPILKAKVVDNMLQYYFCIPRLKSVAMITERYSEDILSDDIKKLMRTRGWYCYTIDQYQTLQYRDFGFVIIDSKLWNDDKIVQEQKEQKKHEVIDCVRKISHSRYYVAAQYTNIAEHVIKTDLFEIFAEKFTNEREFENEELNLYVQLAGGSDFEIAIADNDPDSGQKTTDKLHSSSPKVKLLDVEIDVINNYKYIYRKHNDTKKEFCELKDLYGGKKFYGELEFVEGITGGNSTDRLVRHMNLDDFWAYKQIHAMRTKVAIFDERIFTKVTGIEMSDLTSSPVETWAARIGSSDNVKAAKKIVYDYDQRKWGVENKRIKDAIFREYQNLKTMKEVICFADKYCPIESSNPQKANDFSSMVFHKKGIDVFSITQNSSGGFTIWGFVPDESFNNELFGMVRSVGNMVIGTNGEVSLQMSDMKYHYLSIHQGLLDKIYEIYKESDSGNSVAKMKKGVTKALHDKLIIDNASNADDYLQGLIIHSGRSKPNEENMPQHQPFVQYSAIENAVFDCKNTLVELLDFASFEN